MLISTELNCLRAKIVQNTVVEQLYVIHKTLTTKYNCKYCNLTVITFRSCRLSLFCPADTVFVETNLLMFNF